MASSGAPIACGTQVRLPGSRRRVGPGVARTESFRQKTVQRFDAEYLFKVREHSAGRNRAAGELLAILSFLRNYGAIPAGAHIDWDRAHVQAIRGSATADAAHNLPCQILINGRFPWDLVSGSDIDANRIMSELRGLFGAVYVAPKVFNAADSISESCCLRGALAGACADVIARTKPIQRGAGVLKRGVGMNYGDIQLRTSDVANPGAGIDAGAVGDAFQVWLRESRAAFDRAIEFVRDEGASSMGQDVTDDVIYILQRYSSAALTATPPAGAWLSELEQSFWRASV